MSATPCMKAGCGNTTTTADGYCYHHHRDTPITMADLQHLLTPPSEPIGDDQQDWFPEWDAHDWSEDSAFEFYSRGFAVHEANRWYECYTFQAYGASNRTWLTSPEETAEYAEMWRDATGRKIPDFRWSWARMGPAMYILPSKANLPDHHTPMRMVANQRVYDLPYRYDKERGEKQEELWATMFRTPMEDIQGYMAAGTRSLITMRSYNRYNSGAASMLSAATEGFLFGDEPLDGKGELIMQQTRMLHDKGFSPTEITTMIRKKWPNSSQAFIDLIKDQPDLDCRMISLTGRGEFTKGVDMDELHARVDQMRSANATMRSLGYDPGTLTIPDSAQEYVRQKEIMRTVPQVIQRGMSQGARKGYDGLLERIHDRIDPQTDHKMKVTLKNLIKALDVNDSEPYARVLIEGTGDPDLDAKVTDRIIAFSEVGSSSEDTIAATDSLVSVIAGCHVDEWVDLLAMNQMDVSSTFDTLYDCGYDLETARVLLKLTS